MSGRPNFGDALIRHFAPRHKKHAENITIYLQCLNRLNGKDAAVLGKQVLMLNEKKISKYTSIIKSLLCSRPPCKPFRKYVHKELLDFKSPLGPPTNSFFRTRGTEPPGPPHQGNPAKIVLAVELLAVFCALFSVTIIY